MFDVHDFARTYLSFLKSMQQAAEQPGDDLPWFTRRLHEHFGADPGFFPVVSRSVPRDEVVNLQLALDEWFAELRSQGGEVRTDGVGVRHSWEEISLSTVASGAGSLLRTPIETEMFHAPNRLPIHLSRRVLHTCSTGVLRAALLLFPTREGQYVHLQIMCSDRDAAEAIAEDLFRRAERLNVYRGHILTVGCGSIEFASIPHVEREHVILPASTLDLIDRQTVAFSLAAERLRAAGQHLKRGVLLYGPPGTGKTLTAMYLATRMAGRTTILVSGHDYRSLTSACDYARRLAPASVILEDVDLVASERETGRPSAVLHELMNQMDGLATDIDVLFVLTTNRPEAIERAVASRPGRIDQAIEVPLPDGACRRRLMDLYARNINLRLDDIDGHIARTEGVSATFIREMLRRACVIAYSAGSSSVVDSHVSAAISEMCVGPLAARLRPVAAQT